MLEQKFEYRHYVRRVETRHRVTGASRAVWSAIGRKWLLRTVYMVSAIGIAMATTALGSYTASQIADAWNRFVTAEQSKRTADQMSRVARAAALKAAAEASPTALPATGQNAATIVSPAALPLERDMWRDGDESETSAMIVRGEQETYRTVCVRLCDGFYFPISPATTHEYLKRDQHTCASSCAAPTRLYIMSARSGSPETMKDINGRPYRKLGSAFQFRAKYDGRCTCGPQPWEAESRQRHERLAAAEAHGRGDDVRTEQAGAAAASPTVTQSTERRPASLAMLRAEPQAPPAVAVTDAKTAPKVAPPDQPEFPSKAASGQSRRAKPTEPLSKSVQAPAKQKTASGTNSKSRATASATPRKDKAVSAAKLAGKAEQRALKTATNSALSRTPQHYYDFYYPPKRRGRITTANEDIMRAILN